MRQKEFDYTTFLTTLTTRPGVYRMLNAEGRVLYVGKAKNLKKRVSGQTIKGALYFSCLGRGRSLFGPDSAELGMIKAEFGDIPLTGFFCNGEIAHDQLYGYTGVLTIFL